MFLFCAGVDGLARHEVLSHPILRQPDPSAARSLRQSRSVQNLPEDAAQVA
jgi:hypothetical protein